MSLSIKPRVATVTPERATQRARLIVVRGNEPGRIYPVDVDELLLGRVSSAEAKIGDDGVSREHARIHRSPAGEWLVEDLGSMNGTFVNDEKVACGPLAFGDRLRLGHNIEMLFTEDDSIQEELLQRQRFEAVGRLSLGIAHDFNNMLATLSATLDYLGHTPPAALEEGDYMTCIGDMQVAVERATKLASRLLHSATASTGRPERVCVSSLVHEVTQLARRSLPRNIKLDLAIAPRMNVLGDPVAIHQVLMNLMVNARDAMPDGGCLAIRLSGARTGPSARVSLEVEDTGVGMDAETQRRIFEPFFTTKGAGLGFGLGLATVKTLIERHGGTIEVHSHPGQGTRFRIRLPADTARPARRATTRTHETVVSERLTVLLADDEPVLRRALRRVMVAARLEVVEAADGASALVLGSRPECPVDVAILDVDMPGLDGIEVAKRLLAVRPTLPVLILSGHDTASLRERLGDTPVVAVLKKPLQTNELVAAVNAAWSLRRCVGAVGQRETVA
jgi:two-component system, cell cycle sensor histidine kinase and response regulator CckA